MRMGTKERQKKEFLFNVMNRLCLAYTDFSELQKIQYKPVVDYKVLKTLKLSIELGKPLHSKVRSLAIDVLDTHSQRLYKDFKKHIDSIKQPGTFNNQPSSFNESGAVYEEVLSAKFKLSKKYEDTPPNERGPKPTNRAAYLIAAKKLNKRKGNCKNEYNFESVRKSYARFKDKIGKQYAEALAFVDNLGPDDKDDI